MSCEYNLLFQHDTVPSIDELILFLEQSDLFIEKKDGTVFFKEFRDRDGWPAMVHKDNSRTLYLAICDHKSHLTTMIYDYMKNSNVILVDVEEHDPLPWSTFVSIDNINK